MDVSVPSSLAQTTAESEGVVGEDRRVIVRSVFSVTLAGLVARERTPSKTPLSALLRPSHPVPKLTVSHCLSIAGVPVVRDKARVIKV